MATYKRRIVYLSDEEWANIRQQAERASLTASAYLRQIVVATSLGLNVQRPIIPRDGDYEVSSKGTIEPIEFDTTPVPTRKAQQAERDRILRAVHKGG